MLDMCPFKQEDGAVVFLVYYSCTFSFLPVNPIVSFVCSVALFTSLILLLSIHSAQGTGFSLGHTQSCAVQMLPKMGRAPEDEFVEQIPGPRVGA